MDHTKIMQSSVNQIEQQKSELRKQIEQVKQKLFEDKDIDQQQENRRLERSVKEATLTNEIKQIQFKLDSLRQGVEEQRDGIRKETQSLIELQGAFEAREKEFKVHREKLEDENQIKNVLMMRIRDLEFQQEERRSGQHDFDNQIFALQQSQGDLLA